MSMIKTRKSHHYEFCKQLLNCDYSVVSERVQVSEYQGYQRTRQPYVITSTPGVTMCIDSRLDVLVTPDTLDWLHHRFGVSLVFLDCIVYFAWGPKWGSARWTIRDEQGRIERVG